MSPPAKGVAVAVSALASAAGLAARALDGAGALPAGGVPLLAAGTGVGFGGMLLDAWLGAAAQGRLRCPACDVPSEWTRHRCGVQTQHLGGIRWLSNDGVHGLATTAGAWAGWLAWRCCSPS
jgi:uncharacterized membrane protein